MLGSNQRSITEHIFPTSSNLLGICFVLLSFIRLSNLAEESMIDEGVGIAIILFLFASLLSYASMRSPVKSEIYETLADYIFLAGLGLLALMSVVIVIQLM